MKTCFGCKKDKPDEGFGSNKGAKDGLQTYCIPCRRISCNAWNLKHKERNKIRNGETRFKNKLSLISKLGGKCVKCDTNNIYHLQVDHIKNDGQKEKYGGAYLYVYYLKNLEEAKKKFQILCANCNIEKQLRLYPHFPKLAEKYGFH